MLNSLRIVDPEQPEYNGSSGACQIDHLVVHQWGMFIVESKSARNDVFVGPDGHGGDEWTRVYQGMTQGFASPIRQGKEQGEFLRRFLQLRREQVLGKVPGALGILSKIKNGTNQRGFLSMPVQVIVAYSEAAILHRKNGWVVPKSPFNDFVVKADQVGTRIREELDRHRAGSRLMSAAKDNYGIWDIKSESAQRVADFLADQAS